MISFGEAELMQHELDRYAASNKGNVNRVNNLNSRKEVENSESHKMKVLFIRDIPIYANCGNKRKKNKQSTTQN